METNNLTTKYNIIDSENIRERIKRPITEIDRKIKFHIDNGILMTDVFLMESLIQDWSYEKKNIIVNFPKNIEQLSTLKYYLEKFKETIEKIIYFKITDFDKVYNVAQKNYGKMYDLEYKEYTVNLMKKHSQMSEKIINKLNKSELIEIDFFGTGIKDII